MIMYPDFSFMSQIFTRNSARLKSRSNMGLRIVNGATGLILFFIASLAHAQLVANPDIFGVPFGQPLVVEALGVLENDTLDGETDVGLTAELVTPVTNGTLICPGATEAPFELCANGSFQYTPGPGFSGTASFTYRALNGITPSAPATVTLTDCMEISPQVFSCWLESSYRAKLTELGSIGKTNAILPAPRIY